MIFNPATEVVNKLGGQTLDLISEATNNHPIKKERDLLLVGEVGRRLLNAFSEKQVEVTDVRTVRDGRLLKFTGPEAIGSVSVTLPPRRLPLLPRIPRYKWEMMVPDDRDDVPRESRIAMSLTVNHVPGSSLEIVRLTYGEDRVKPKSLRLTVEDSGFEKVDQGFTRLRKQIL